MFIRIVKMHFKIEALPAFFEVFEEVKDQIRGFEGCEHLELLQDKNNPHFVFTYSYWKDPADLEKYRHSTLFKTTWERTKIHFDGKPEAWSVDQLQKLP